MQSILTFIATGLLAVAPAIAGDNTPDVVAFRADVRVEVDASGKPVKVEAPRDLPDSIRAFIEQRVASWQYTPATRDGKPQAATTYVQVGACAIPSGTGSYHLGVDFKGNGPGIANDRGYLVPPAYPMEALLRRATGEFAVVMAIRQDGTTEVVSVTPGETHARASDVKAMTIELRQWANGLRFNPESVAGVAVTTQLLVSVVFMVDNGDIDARRREIREAALGAEECRLAGGAGPGIQPVAINSPVMVTPTPAG